MTDPMDDLRQASADVSGVELKGPLSPAAEAVLNAVTLKRYDVPYYACPASIDQIKADAAAVLWAVANQLTHRVSILELNMWANELEGFDETSI